MFSSIHHNAASLMQLGLNEAAIGVLRYALSEVESRYAHDGKITTASPSSSCYDPVIGTLKTDDDFHDDTNMFMLFDEAFLLYSESGLGGGLHEIQIQSALLLFNMGLAYHKQGLHYGCNYSISSAFRVYESCLDALELLWVDPAVGAIARSEINLVALATLNNLGHLNYFCLRRDGVLRCCQTIEAVLSAKQSVSDSPEHVDFLQYISTLVFATDPHQVLAACPAA